MPNESGILFVSQGIFLDVELLTVNVIVANQ